jgi:hypothetical protein
MNNKGEPPNNFVRISHKIFEHKNFKKLPFPAKVLYMTLYHLRNRYAKDGGIFYRSLEALAEDSGMSIDSVKRGKKINQG